MGNRGDSATEAAAEGTRSLPRRTPDDVAGDDAGLARGAALGRFTVLDQLGAGGMGIVLAAYDPDLDRRVAIKLLKRDAAGVQDRLVREAQAMARVTHPNVITVYDVGMVDDRVFVAMEHLDGGTLAEWLETGPRTWRDILHLYLAAGRGLAAAHAANLVHRDFKPENVLLGKDGRIRVSDFGLARAVADDATRRPDGSPSASDRALGAALTRAGDLLGTPSYMAPEQLRGEVAGPASDQFSYCVALYRGLYGKRPFPGDTHADLTAAVLAGKPEAPPRTSSVPAWLWPILQRGLSAEVERRHPSLQSALDLLDADPTAGRRRRLTALGAGVLAAAALTTIFVVARTDHGPAGPDCTRAGARAAAVWNDGARRELSAAFAASGRGHAASTSERVAQLLDRHTAAWSAMRIDTCRATYVRGEQSPALLDLRMTCLDRKIAQLAGLIELLRKADGELVDQSLMAVDRLGSLESCADHEALTSATPPPADPAARAALAALTARIDPIHALFIAGKYKQARDQLAALTPEIERAAHPPLSAESLLLQASLQNRTGDPSGAETTLYRAADAAARAKDDGRMARALIELIWVLGVLQPRHDEAIAVGRLAETVILRAGDGGELLGKLHMNLGSIHGQQGQLAASREYHQRAYDELSKALGPGRAEVATALANLGVVAWQEGRLDDARTHFERALAARETALGSTHTEVGDSLLNLAAVLATQGDFEHARPLSQRALAIYEANLPAGDPRISSARLNHANMLVEDNHLDEARRLYERVLTDREAVHGKEHPEVAVVLGNLGNTLRQLGDHDAALLALERALRIREATLGAEHPAVGKALHDLGAAHDHAGDDARARHYFDRALAVRRAALGADHPEVAESLGSIADRRRAQHRCGDARSMYEQALAVLERIGGPDDPRSGHARLGLGECLVTLGRGDEAEPHLRAAIALLGAPGDHAELAAAQAALLRARRSARVERR